MNRSEPFADDHSHSKSVKGDRIRHQPRKLADYLAWLTHQYALEAPTRLHDRDVADDGAPDHTGEAKSWLGMAQERTPNDWREVACARDADGYRRTPMRCAIARISDPDRRALLGGLAVNLLTPLDVTRAHGIPDWAASDVMWRSLTTLWALYEEVPIPRRSWVDLSDSQRAAEEAA
jgi:hypothetical protein